MSKKESHPLGKLKVLYVSFPSNRAFLHLDPSQEVSANERDKAISALFSAPFASNVTFVQAHGEPDEIHVEFGPYDRQEQFTDRKKLIELVKPVYKNGCFVNIRVDRDSNGHQTGLNVEMRPARDCRSEALEALPKVDGMCRLKVIDHVPTFSVVPPFPEGDYDGVETAEAVARRAAEKARLYVTNVQVFDRDERKSLLPAYDPPKE